MTKEEIKTALEEIWDKLDDLQEQDVAQDNPELMHDIGEAMGATANAIDDILKQDKPADQEKTDAATRYFDFFNIDWDTSDWGEKEEIASGVCVPDLPEEVDYVGIDDPNWDPDEDGADLLSDMYGYCVKSFEWEEVKE